MSLASPVWGIMGLWEASPPSRCKRKEPPFGGSVGDGRAGPATSTRHGWKQLPLIIEAPLGQCRHAARASGVAGSARCTQRCASSQPPKTVDRPERQPRRAGSRQGLTMATPIVVPTPLVPKRDRPRVRVAFAEQQPDQRDCETGAKPKMLRSEPGLTPTGAR